MPCMGCGKNVRRIIVKLRFIGRPGGKLVKGAPGNYKQGDIVSGPLTWAKTFPKIWELVESPPELHVSDMERRDSVFEEPVFVPPEDEPFEEDEPPQLVPRTAAAAKEVTLPDSTDAELDVRTREVAENYRKQGMYLLDADKGVVVSPDESTDKDPRSRDELRAILDAAGVKYSKHSRTETLAKMVQTIESKENS